MDTSKLSFKYEFLRIARIFQQEVAKYEANIGQKYKQSIYETKHKELKQREQKAKAELEQVENIVKRGIGLKGDMIDGLFKLQRAQKELNELRAKREAQKQKVDALKGVRG